MAKQYVLGLDIGTTSTKAVLFTRDGTVVCEQESFYSMYHQKPGWAEQDPQEIEAALLHAIKLVVHNSKVSVKDWLGVGFSAAMHSLLCLDEKGSVLSPVLIWADLRSEMQAAKVREQQTDIYKRTGTPIHPMSPLVKLIWMKEKEYEPYKQAAYFVSMKEYLCWKWFGEKLVDYATASASGLFDIRTFTWDKETLQLAGVSEEQLFAPVEPTTVLSCMKPDISKQLGLPPSLPFVIGATDGPLANLGIGSVDETSTAITIGTSGAIRQFRNSPTLSENQRSFCYAFTKNRWITGGPTNNGAVVIDWLKSEIIADKTRSVEAYIKLAEGVSPGANGLLFLPFLLGERAPYWDATARASFIGLTHHHKQGHLVRACLEGVILNMYTIATSVFKEGTKANKIYASGGFARSSLWLQILADVFEQTVVVPTTHQSSAWGAAWIALYSLGEVSSIEGIHSSISFEKEVFPMKEHALFYKQLYLVFANLYEQLHGTFQQLRLLEQHTFNLKE